MPNIFSKFRKKTSLPPHPSKTFAGDLNRFNDMIASGQAFALSRFGDGEMIVINGNAIDLSDKHHGEHRYQPKNETDEAMRAVLTDALHYQSDNYFVAIACPCCVGKERFLALKAQSEQKESQLTWANIFVNSNYPTFRSETVKALQSREPMLFVGHEKSNVEGLPFKVEKHFNVGGNAWVNDYARLKNELTADLLERTSNTTVIFCAGVLSNLLIYTLAKQMPQHTYIDCGSVFDVDLGLGQTRKYLKKGKTLKRTCVWV